MAASIVNITIGGGIFRLPAPIAGVLGPAAPIAYLVCAVTMGLIVLCFAEAGSRVSLTGGVYAFVDLSLGPVVGFFAGFMLWSAITVAAAAVASFFADALGSLVPAMASPGLRIPLLVIVLAALAALNVVGVRGASRFNTAVTVAKLVPLVALVVFGSAAVRSGEPRVARGASRRATSRARRPCSSSPFLAWRARSRRAAKSATRGARFRARSSSQWAWSP